MFHYKLHEHYLGYDKMEDDIVFLNVTCLIIAAYHLMLFCWHNSCLRKIYIQEIN